MGLYNKIFISEEEINNIRELLLELEYSTIITYYSFRNERDYVCIHNDCVAVNKNYFATDGTIIVFTYTYQEYCNVLLSELRKKKINNLKINNLKVNNLIKNGHKG